MTEQIDNLLTPRVMVTNPWFGGCHKAGEVLTENEYGVITVRNTGLTEQMTAAELCAKYKGNFREMHWSEGREPEQMPRYVCFNEMIVAASKWHFDGDVTITISPIRTERVSVGSVTPATSDQYLEYLTQQSKP